MTVQEIEQARERAALGLLTRSGVGYIFAVNKFDAHEIETMKKLSLAGSDVEAMVKMALEFAFYNVVDFSEYMVAESSRQSHMRFFRPVR